MDDSKLDQLVADAEAIEKALGEIADDAEAVIKRIEGAVPKEFDVDGIIKDYKEAASDSNGLTTMKPSVVKLLGAIDESPTKKAIADGRKAVDDHLEEVTKAHGKDASVKEHYKAFAKAMADLLKRIDALDAVDG